MYVKLFNNEKKRKYIYIYTYIYIYIFFLIKDRHQWLGREFRGSLSLNMDRLFLNAIIYELYH